MNERGHYEWRRTPGKSNMPGYVSIVAVITGTMLVRHWVKR